MCSLKTTAATLLFIFVCFAKVSAQTATGAVNGTVVDPNGAAVPGAVVKLINQATNIETEATASSNGYFTFVNLKPGKYVLRVEVQGFKGIQTPPFDVGVSETVTQNLELTRQKFDTGISDNVEVVQSQEALSTANTDYINSVFAHNLAKLSLARAIGRASEALPRFLKLQ